MKVDFIWITNYKSICNRNKLVVDPSVTAVIGKNESGKSNLIEIIGAISLTKGIPNEFFKRTTQGVSNAKLIIEVQCSFSKEELELLGLKSSSMISKFVISEDNSPFNVAISGGVQDYFNNDNFKKDLEFLGDVIKKYINEINNHYTRNKLQENYDNLMKAFDYVIPNYANYLSNIKRNISPNLKNEMKKEFENLCERLIRYFSRLYDLFPVFYHYKENMLLNHYNVTNEFFEKDSEQLRSLTKLITAAGCKIQDVKDACIYHPHDGIGMDAKRRIERGIKNKIEKGFNQFYKQDEYVEVMVDLKPNLLSIYVNTSGPTTLLSERSDGLKWFLNMYIDILVNNLEDKNVVFLIDEPGVFLHVDAQKKVLELFDELSRENQIIYTTHSPFMLDENRIDRIRVMQKNREGYSEIISSVMSEKIAGKSNSETLSPLVSALGMKLYQNLGMDKDKLNVITEGFTDAIYLSTMSKILEINHMKFVPSIGASKVVYLANILWAWGFPFKVLFDWDNAGREGRKKVLGVYFSDSDSEEAQEFAREHIMMISDIFTDQPNMDDVYTIESLIDEIDYENIGLDNSLEEIRKNSNLKNLLANKFAEAVTQGTVTLSQKTLDNFKLLFEKLNENSVPTFRTSFLYYDLKRK